MKDLDKRLNEIQAELTELRKMVEPEQPYIPQPGEVVEVSDSGSSWQRKIYLKHGNENYKYCCSALDKYREGFYCDNVNWKFCRRLSGEIIEFGCDKPKQQGSFVTDSAKADDIHDALKYLHFLPEGYFFCDEADAEKWVKVSLYEWNGSQNEIGNITTLYHSFVPLIKKSYRPICKIQPGKHPKTNERTSRIFNSAIDSPQVRTDYSHLLPDGYEFCKEEEAESWLKVEQPDSNEPQSPMGTIMSNKEVDYFSDKLKSMYRPVRKIIQPKTNPYQVDWSSAPEWADVHCFDEDGTGWWSGCEKSTHSWGENCSASGFTLPSGLDWKQSKTRRVN